MKNIHGHGHAILVTMTIECVKAVFYILYKCRMWVLLWMAIDVGPPLYMIHVQFMGLILETENMELLEC